MAASPAVVGAVRAEVEAAVEALRQDAQLDLALGDAQIESRNSEVSEAARSLTRIASGSENAAKVAMDAGAIEAAIYALRSRPNSEKVQTEASQCLGRLAASCGLESQCRCSEAGGVEAAIDALTGHPNSVAVQENAVAALQCLVDTCPEAQVRAKKAGGTEALLQVLDLHSDNEVLQSKASLALARLAFGDEARQEKVLAIIIRSLRKHIASECVQECCLQALGYLIKDNATARLQAQCAGALEVVLQSLRRAQGSSKSDLSPAEIAEAEARLSTSVQAASLGVLGALVMGGVEGQNSARLAGALEAVAQSLTGHEDEQVHVNACEALGQLTLDNRASQAHARELGLLQEVIQRVLNEPGRAESVKAKAVWALGCIVGGDMENQRVAGELGAIHTTMATLSQQPDSGDNAPCALLECALFTLGQLTACNAKNQAVAKESGVLMAILAALWQTDTKQREKATALGALADFVTSCPENTKAAVELGAIDEVLSAMKLRSGCWAGADDSPSGAATQELPQSQEANHLRKLAREAGLIVAAVGALFKPPKRAQVEGDYRKSAAASPCRILSILGQLVAGDPENQLVAGGVGLVEEVISVLKTREKTEETHLQALKALANLVTKCAPNQRRAKAVGVTPVLLEVKRQYQANTFLQAAAILVEAVFHSRGSFTNSQMLRTPFAARLQTHVPIADVAMRGITLHQFRDLASFIEDCLNKYDFADASIGSNNTGRSVIWETMDMYQMKDSFLLPLTQANHCSYVESVAAGKQPPMWMISHWWGTPFANTMRMLGLQAKSRCLRETGSSTFWCCTMANNQHNLCDLDDPNVMKSPFARAMLSERCMGTVLLCDPAVTPLMRIWCVFEAHITQKLRCGMIQGRVDKQFFLDIVAPVAQQDSSGQESNGMIMTMLQDAAGGSWQEVSDRPGVFFPLQVAEIGVRVDLCKAKASVEADRLSILNFVASGVGSTDPPPSEHPNYESLNVFVHSVFASAELYRLACERPEGCVEAAAKLLQLHADVNSFVREGNTALLAAVGADSNTSVVPQTSARIQHEFISLLLAGRADPNEANSHKKTAYECAKKLTVDTRQLLRDHGALTYVEAAPALERKTNEKMAQLLAAGFSTEWQAFQGGEAGTKLTGTAQRSLQAVAANVLNRYPWASCRVSIQTSASKRQEALAAARADALRHELESAHCANDFDLCCGSQNTLVCITVELEPPAPKSVDRDLIGRKTSHLTPIPSVSSTGSTRPTPAVSPTGSTRATPASSPHQSARGVRLPDAVFSPTKIGSAPSLTWAIGSPIGSFPKRQSSSGSSIGDIRRGIMSPGLPPCAPLPDHSSSSLKPPALHSNAYKLPAIGDSLQRMSTSQSVSSEPSPVKSVSYSPDLADSQSPIRALQCETLSPLPRSGRGSGSLASPVTFSMRRKSPVVDEEALSQSRSAPNLVSASGSAVISPQRPGSTVRRVFSVADLNKS